MRLQTRHVITLLEAIPGASVDELAEWLRGGTLPAAPRQLRTARETALKAASRARADLAPHGLTVLVYRVGCVTRLRLAQMSGADMTRALEAARAAPVNSREHRERQRCRRGHPLEGANLYVLPQGTRVCRTCRGTAQRTWKRSVAQRQAGA